MDAGALPAGGTASILDAVGRGFLDAASSIDANIDASSLVDRLRAPDLEVTGTVVKRSIGELKELICRAPVAVVATEGAIPAIVRIITQLADKCDTEEEADTEECLQDALEALGQLLRDDATPGASPDGKHRSAAVSAELSLTVARAVVEHTEDGKHFKQILRVLGARSVSTQYDVIIVLQRVYRMYQDPVSDAFLADPIALNRLMGILQTCHIDYVRNESLGLLLLLTASNSNVQQIVTMQGLADTIFELLLEEDLGVGGRIARDLISCLGNVAGNATCQRCIRETGGIPALVAALEVALLGKRAAAAEDESDDDEVAVAAPVPRLDGGGRWTCFHMLADCVFTLCGEASEESIQDVADNRDALVRGGVLDLLRSFSSPTVATEAKLRLVGIFDVLGRTKLAAAKLQHADQEEHTPILTLLASNLITGDAPVPLRNAILKAVCRTISIHSDLQLSLLVALTPQIGDTSEEVPAGRRVIALLEQAATFQPGPNLWYAFHLLLAMIQGNANVQSALPTMRIAFAGTDDAPAELFLDLLLMAVSGCAKEIHADTASDDVEPDETILPGSAAPDSPCCAPASLVSALKFLAYWFSCCPSTITAFISSPVVLPQIMDLMDLGKDITGDFFRTQIEGLSALIMGICLKAEIGQDTSRLIALVAKKVGIEEFYRKVDRILRSEVLQRPSKVATHVMWYDVDFRTFARETQQAIQRHMVQVYVNEGINSGGSLAEDVADQYKQLIRVQDDRFQQVQHENEQLRSEVEAFMRRSLQASSQALPDKIAAMRLENDALHKEVLQLEERCGERVSRLERELQQSRLYIRELEHQRQAVAVGYEQVEKTCETLRCELARAKVAPGAAERASRYSGPSEDCLTLALEAEEQQLKAQELQVERANLLDLFGRIIAEHPEVRGMLAGISELSASSLAGGEPA